MDNIKDLKALQKEVNMLKSIESEEIIMKRFISPTQFGRLIKKRRMDFEIKQFALAEAVGISSSTLCYIEHGRTFPNFSTAYLLLKELGLGTIEAIEKLMEEKDAVQEESDKSGSTEI